MSSLFDIDSDRSFHAFFRNRRAVLVRAKILAAVEATGGCRIIDLGGREAYWRHVGLDFLRAHNCTIVLLNQMDAPAATDPLFEVVKGDACATGYPDNAFDLVHSNSVIEHVGGWAHMVAFANEVKRLAPSFYIQTPNYYFPLEPHFRTIGFQWLPVWARVALHRRMRLGFIRRIPDAAEAARTIEHYRLLKPSEVAALFGKSTIRFERFLGLNKSIIAIR